MEETKEAKAARKEISEMEEARAECKKYSTEAMVGKLILAGLDSRSYIIVWERRAD